MNIKTAVLLLLSIFLLFAEEHYEQDSLTFDLEGYWEGIYNGDTIRMISASYFESEAEWINTFVTEMNSMKGEAAETAYYFSSNKEQYSGILNPRDSIFYWSFYDYPCWTTEPIMVLTSLTNDTALWTFLDHEGIPYETVDSTKLTVTLIRQRPQDENDTAFALNSYFQPLVHHLDFDTLTYTGELFANDSTKQIITWNKERLEQFSGFLIHSDIPNKEKVNTLLKSFLPEDDLEEFEELKQYGESPLSYYRSDDVYYESLPYCWTGRYLTVEFMSRPMNWQYTRSAYTVIDLNSAAIVNPQQWFTMFYDPEEEEYFWQESVDYYFDYDDTTYDDLFYAILKSDDTLAEYLNIQDSIWTTEYDSAKVWNISALIPTDKGIGFVFHVPEFGYGETDYVEVPYEFLKPFLTREGKRALKPKKR